MGITVHKILSKVDQFSIVELAHGSKKFEAKVWNEADNLQNQIGKENILVEMNYNDLIGVKLIKDFNDFDSGILQNALSYFIKGRVIQMIKTENDIIIDLYLQTGPDFLSILKSEIGDLELNEEQGVQVEVTGLMFFPRKTK